MAQLTISQGLRRVKKCKGRLAELTARASASVSYEAGKKPSFDFKATRAEVAKVRAELVGLEAAIARANATATVSVDGKSVTLAEAIRWLQEFKAEMAWLPQLVLRTGTERTPDVEWDENLGRQVRRSREVVWTSELSEPDRAAELESLRDRFERLNDAVETANHRTPIEWAAAEQSATAAS